MDYQNHNTESRKNKHLNMKERMIVEIRLKDGFSAYKIAKELHKAEILKEWEDACKIDECFKNYPFDFDQWWGVKEMPFLP